MISEKAVYKIYFLLVASIFFDQYFTEYNNQNYEGWGLTKRKTGTLCCVTLKKSTRWQRVYSITCNNAHKVLGTVLL